MSAFDLETPRAAASGPDSDNNNRSNHASESILLIEPELPYLRRYAWALTRDVDRADDLVQECVARAIQNIDKWQPGTEMRPWLIVITRNLFYNQCRRSKREWEAMTEIGLGENHATPAAQDAHIEYGDVANAFSTLSDDHREVLVLVVIEGMNYEAAAKIMGVRSGTVKSRLSRARQQLKDAVDPGGSCLA